MSDETPVTAEIVLVFTDGTSQRVHYRGAWTSKRGDDGMVNDTLVAFPVVDRPLTAWLFTVWECGAERPCFHGALDRPEDLGEGDIPEFPPGSLCLTFGAYIDP